MKKSSKIVGIVAVLIVAGLLYSWPLIQMEFAGSAHYTEQDKREYAFYTPDILKKMPRISPVMTLTSPTLQVLQRMSTP
ncbi:hypothetical protein GGER_33560 [Serratia rubidaea]